MNEKTKFYLKLIGAFIAGIIFTNLFSVSSINEIDWRKLKDIDDQIIGTCANALLIQSESWECMSRFDSDCLQTKTDETKALSPILTELKNKRLELLGKIGY